MAARVLAVVNRKGGVGKTTTAVSLAHGLARRLQNNGKEFVLLVDLDPQGNVGTCLGVSPSDGDISDVLLGEMSVEKAVIPAGKDRAGLYVLLATDRLADAKAEILADVAARQAVKSIMRSSRKKENGGIDHLLEDRLRLAKQAFKYIILDCPPSLDIFNNAVYRFADAAIVPVKMDYLGAMGTRQHTENIAAAQVEGIDIRIDVVLPTFYRSREILPGQMLAALIKFYGPRVVADPIPQAAVLERAPAVGHQTIWEYAPDSPAAEAYWKLVERIYNKR
jgi:chromosome partitioning protein